MDPGVCSLLKVLIFFIVGLAGFGGGGKFAGAIGGIAGVAVGLWLASVIVGSLPC